MVDPRKSFKRLRPARPVTVEEGRWLLFDLAHATDQVDVMADPALVFRFAELELTPEAVAAFGGEYGPLGVSDRWSAGWNEWNNTCAVDEQPSADLIAATLAEDDDGEEGHNPLEHVENWFSEIRRACAAVDAWTDLSEDAEDKLKARLHMVGGRWSGQVLFDGIASRDRFTGDLLDGVLVDDYTGTTDGSGRPIAAAAVRAGLRTFISSMIRNRSVAEFRLVDGAESLVAVPTSLLGTLWIQLGQALVASLLARRCATCGRLIWIDGRHGRKATRMYCPPPDGETVSPCGHKGYRQRRARALELIASGYTAWDAAVEVDARVESVEGWVRSVRKMAATGRPVGKIAQRHGCTVATVNLIISREEES